MCVPTNVDADRRHKDLLLQQGPRALRSTSPDESDHRSKPPDPNHRSEPEGGGRYLVATVICRIGRNRSPRESPIYHRALNKELCQAHEALRDLVRARDDAKADLLRAKWLSRCLSTTQDVVCCGEGRLSP